MIARDDCIRSMAFRRYRLFEYPHSYRMRVYVSHPVGLLGSPRRSLSGFCTISSAAEAHPLITVSSYLGENNGTKVSSSTAYPRLNKVPQNWQTWLLSVVSRELSYHPQ